MKLSIENIAKIKDAQIDIDGITVIAGENNTGKSTIGKILYSIYESFNNLPGKVFNERKRSISSIVRRGINPSFKYKDDEFDKVSLITEKLIGADINDIDRIIEEENIDLTSGFLKRLKEVLSYDDDKLASLIVRNIFDTEFNDQVLPVKALDTQHGIIRLTIKNHEKNEVENIELRISENSTLINEKIDLYNDAIYIDDPFIIDDISEESSLKFNRFIFLRSGRFFSENEHRISLIKKLAKSSKNDESTLVDKGILIDRLTRFEDIIKETMQGDFLVKNNKTVFYDSKNNTEIELSNLSTGMKAFAIILKLIENQAIGDKSMLVLDEPEIHLHPKWQIKFAELLVMLQKEFDMNIVLASHSPYFISAIQAYAIKHDISSKCNYYLSGLDDEDNAIFKNVTDNTGLIFDLLAEPFNELDEIVYGK